MEFPFEFPVRFSGQVLRFSGPGLKGRDASARTWTRRRRGRAAAHGARGWGRRAAPGGETKGRYRGSEFFLVPNGDGAPSEHQNSW